MPIPKRRSLSWTTASDEPRSTGAGHGKEKMEGRGRGQQSRILRFDALESSRTKSWSRMAAQGTQGHRPRSLAQLDLLHGPWDKRGDSEPCGSTSEQSNRRPRTMILHARPSSTILGDQGAAGAEAPDASDCRSSKVFDGESSSNARSHYDPERSPLAISQQTSASSSRDLALRKGCRTVKADRMDKRRRLQDAKMFYMSQKHSRQPFDKANDEEHADPLQLDLAKLFPTPQPAHDGALLSPRRLTRSPSSLSLVSERSSTPVVDEAKGSNSLPALDTDVDSNVRGTEQPPSNQPSPSLTAQEVYASNDASQPSFERTSPSISRSEEIRRPITERNNSYRADTSQLISIASDETLRPSSSSSLRKSILADSIKSDRESVKDFSAAVKPSARSAQSWEGGSTSTAARRRSRLSKQSADRTLSGSDLRRQSFLALSSEEESSDDESSGDTSLTTFEEDEYDANALVCSAQTIFIKPAGQFDAGMHSTATVNVCENPVSMPSLDTTTQSSPAQRLSTASMHYHSHVLDVVLPRSQSKATLPVRPRLTDNKLKRTSWLDVTSVDGDEEQLSRPERRHIADLLTESLQPSADKSQPKRSSFRRGYIEESTAESARRKAQDLLSGIGIGEAATPSRMPPKALKQGGVRRSNSKKIPGPQVSFILDEASAPRQKYSSNGRSWSAPTSRQTNKGRPTSYQQPLSVCRPSPSMHSSKRASALHSAADWQRGSKSNERGHSRRRTASSGCMGMEHEGLVMKGEDLAF